MFVLPRSVSCTAFCNELNTLLRWFGPSAGIKSTLFPTTITGLRVPENLFFFHLQQCLFYIRNLKLIENYSFLQLYSFVMYI